MFGHAACKVCACNVFEKRCFESKCACADVYVRKKSRAVITRTWLNTDLKGENKSMRKLTYFLLFLQKESNSIYHETEKVILVYKTRFKQIFTHNFKPIIGGAEIYLTQLKLFKKYFLRFFKTLLLLRKEIFIENI